MGILSKKKNKKFQYQTRYYKGREDNVSPFKMEHKFDNQRVSVTQGQIKLKDIFRLPKLIASIWNRENSIKAEQAVRLRLFVIVAILLLIVLYIFDFDLTIFFTK
jgi:hypothetical protein